MCYYIVLKRLHVKVSTRHWSVLNESDVKQTQFPIDHIKIGNKKHAYQIKSGTSSCAGTINKTAIFWRTKEKCTTTRKLA